MLPGVLSLSWLHCLSAVASHLGVVPVPPYPPSQVIASVSFDFATHVRLAPGSDNWPLTWADDDHQYTAWGDGGGFSGDNDACRVSLGIGRLEGPARGFRGRDLWGDPKCAPNPAQFEGKSRAIVAIDGALYLWGSPGSNVSGLDYQRLYKSTDRGATWAPAGVEWTYHAHRIGLFAVLQYGRDYAGARDGFVYVYATHLRSYAFRTQKPGEIFLLRAPRNRIEDPSAYRFFAGLDDAGSPRWGGFADRKAVFADPNGVMFNSAIYDPGLGRYLLVTNHTRSFAGNVAIFDAPEPWGPWSTVLYAHGWPPGGDVERSVFYANFAPKWWTEDGTGFVFVFTGVRTNDSFNSVEGSFRPAEAPRGPRAPSRARGAAAPHRPR